MSGRIIPYCTLLLVVLTSTIVAWTPFIIKGQFSTIYRHFDGPLYIIPAKTAYNPEVFKIIDREPTLPHSPLYYAAHLPLYPFLIFLGSFIFGYLKSMLGITLLSSVLLSWMMYYFLKKLSITSHPLMLTSFFLFLPRFFVVRSVGSPEPLFLLLTVASLFFFEKKNYLMAGLMGGLATMTKTPGILLFPAYLLVICESLIRNQNRLLQEGKRKSVWTWKFLFLFLIPIGLIIVFGIYHLQFNDFFAYFHSGDNIHLAYPFSVFDSASKWVGTAWLEDILFIFAFYIVTVILLWKSKYRSFFYFGIIFLSATILVQHRDISRYSLPLWPLAVVAFEQQFTSKKSLIIGAILMFGIFMYAWNFLGSNVMPISEWAPFL